MTTGHFNLGLLASTATFVGLLATAAALLLGVGERPSTASISRARTVLEAPPALQGAVAARPAPPRVVEPIPEDAEQPDLPAPRGGWKRLGAPSLAAARTKNARGFTEHRIVHFTFDDGPHPQRTPLLLDALDETGIQATFFVAGRSFGGPRDLERRALLQRMDASGHTVASHTWNHDDLRRLSSKQINADLERLEVAVEATIGYRPGLFRPPYGGRTPGTDRVLRERGYAQVLWTFTPEYGARTAQQVANNFRRALDRMEQDPRGPGGIVLLHDLQARSVEAFPAMVDEIRRRNCELLGQEAEELWMIADDLRPFLVYDDEIPDDLLSRWQAEARREATQRCAPTDDAEAS